jgi:hypothetical protein
MNDFSICKIFALEGLHMNLNHSCGHDAFLIKPCPDVVQALYLLSLKLTLIAYQRGRAQLLTKKLKE